MLLPFTVYFMVPVKASEPGLGEVLSHLGFTNVEEVATLNVTFPAGIYKVTLYAEFAGYHEKNNLSYYEVGGNVYSLIFDGPEGGFGYLSPPITKTIEVGSKFGLSMCTPENHRYFTENSLNPDGQIHSKVYLNKDDPTMYLIGFENLYGAGDRDYQDMVLALQLQPPQNVVPEVPLGTILSMASMILAMFGFAAFKRFK
ncbi:MAG: DUF4114 domain-containing protein [Candidatus Bathyarchaeia archaeon]